MTDTSNNGSGAKTGGASAAAKPKAARKPAARKTTARTSAARTSTAKKATMADETKTTSTSTGASGSAMSAAEERLRATLQQLETRAEELRRWGMARQEMAREVVEDRPLAVVGVAFGVGLLLGLIASRV
jgi:ElaB/YqjD/DUF883 family membrane-anchored ribosome-binding protein